MATVTPCHKECEACLFKKNGSPGGFPWLLLELGQEARGRAAAQGHDCPCPPQYRGHRAKKWGKVRTSRAVILVISMTLPAPEL